MDPGLRRTAIASLKRLKKRLQADLLTVYFWNPYSRCYWLFHKEGGFKFDCQLHGPLTHPDQQQRFDTPPDGKTGQTLMPDVDYFQTIPDDLKRDILGGASFVKRESVNATIRIRIRPQEDASNKNPHVVIFLNYTATAPPETHIVAASVSPFVEFASESFRALARQPRLGQAQAWRLRSLNLRIRNELAGIMMGRDPSESRDDEIAKTEQTMYDLIAQSTWSLFSPRKGSHTLCTVSIVDPHNKIRLVASHPRSIADPGRHGIVEYVARTGQSYYVRDLADYRNLPSDASRPRYLETEKESKCELACPMITEGKVVGVLNLESDQVEAYSDRHVLLLYQFASAAAVPLRQFALSRDLRECIRHQRALLESEDDRAIFESTCKSADALGYDTAIWDFDTSQWYHKPTQPTPRSDGFTRRIAEAGCPLAIADLRHVDAKPTYQVYQGEIDAGSGLFIRWKPGGNLGIDPSTVILSEAKEPGEIVSDLGFPIFSDRSQGKVRAVLWAKCRRYFRSLLSDDAWTLSLFCLNAKQALEVRRRLAESRESPVTTMLEYHFGRKRTRSVLPLLKQDESCLDSKRVDNLVVFSIRINRSKDLRRVLAPDHYVDFIRRYHDLVRKKTVENGGVYDSSREIVQGIFNVYREDLLDVEPHDDLNSSMQNAIACINEIFEEFVDLVNKCQKEAAWKVPPPDDLCIHAGLACGSGFVGSSAKRSVAGVEYTVSGDVADDAKSLEDKARTNELLTAIESAQEGRFRKIYRIVDSERRELSLPDAGQLKTALEHRAGQSLLLMSHEFANAPPPSGSNFFVLPMTEPGNPVLSLPSVSTSYFKI